jgi:hypothetical protein
MRGRDALYSPSENTPPPEHFLYLELSEYSYMWRHKELPRRAIFLQLGSYAT